MEGKNNICLERSNYLKIRAILEKLVLKNKANRHHLQIFLSELNNADIVEDGKLPDDVVKISSSVRYRYTGEAKINTAVLVFPADIGEDPKNLSILSPIGLSMIGRKKDSTTEYLAPGGIYRIEITEVIQEKQHARV